MNVLFIIHHVSGAGGPALQSRKMAQAFERLGHRVSFITMPRGNGEEIAQNSVITSKIFYASKNPLFYPPPLANIYFLKKYQEVSKKFDFEVTQSFDTVVSGPVGAKIFLKERIPSVVRIGVIGKKHYEYLLESGRKGGVLGKIIHKLGISSLMFTKLEQITFQGLGILLPNSNYLAKQYIPFLGKKKVKVIRTGVDLLAFRPIPEKDNKILNEVQLNGSNVITYIGRIEERKGLHIFLKSLKSVLARNKRVKVLIVGSTKTDRHYYEYLVRLTKKLGINNYISFLGRISHDLVPFYISLSDVMVLPSHLSWMEPIEGLPNIVLETMACGKPIVATSVCGVPEIINDGKTGILCKPGDARLFGEKINLVLENPDLAKKIGNNARKYIEKNHDLLKVAKEYIYAYNSLIQ